MAPKGRPPKKKRNITGLRNQPPPVCPIDSVNCCLARLLSQQDDFKNQPSMLETLIKSRGHECIFLPKFHCELNPIEMVSLCQFILRFLTSNNYIIYL
jgi:hypothetical protein